ncbi:MAG: helix-turn-helix transcriptional regulator [Roseibium sp.]|nr:helix-turn-helix transcriptional regulator [Roseibium sp.]
MAQPGTIDGNTSKVAQHIAVCIENLKGVKSQREVAMEAGYDKPNMISMMKTGTARVPLDKVLPLANALETDPALFFRLALEQYWPDSAEAISKIFGIVPSKNERDIMQYIRNITDGKDPALTPEIQKGLDKTFSS